MRHRTSSLRRHLAGLVFAALLPVMVVGGAAAWNLAESYSRAFEARLQDTARALALFLESEIDTHLVAVEALATSPLLRRDDLSEFTEWARGVAAATGGWVVVNEAAPGHRQVVNTGLAPGVPLPPPSPRGEGAWDLIRRVVDSAQPVVSDLFTGRGTGRQLVATAAPVLERGQVTRVVVLAMDPAILSRRLQELGPTGRAYASVADGNGRIVARSLDHERFLGTVPPSRSVSAEDRARGVFRAQSVYGEPSLLAARNLSNAAGWSVVVVEPRAGYRAAWLGPLTAIALSGVAAIAIGLLVATGLARRILRPVTALVRRAEATAAGGDAAPLGTPARVAEFEVLRVASQRAEAALAAREAAYKAIFETAAAGVAEVNATARRYVRVNRRFCAIVGRTEAELLGGLGPHDIFHPEDRLLVPTYRAVAEGREIEDECRVMRPDGSIRWVRASASVSALDASGQAERAVAVLQDITERRQAEEARALLAQEVDHRSKNALAVVRAAVRLTPRTDAEAYARAIEGRVSALARAHTLLADAKWAGADLAMLARAVERTPIRPDTRRNMRT
jgi:PAS domain S-box-containing protein